MSSSHASPDPAQAVAACLIDSGCVTVRADEPFRLPSGWVSPVYMDCRRLISFPAVRRDLVARAIDRLQTGEAMREVASIAGGEASGIAFAAWIAQARELPLQYVRKRAAGMNQVEGVIRKGAKVLLVDDMMAAGASKVAFIGALRSAGAKVQDAFVIFDYGTFGARALLATLGVEVHALATWRDILAVARTRNDFGAAALGELDEFLSDPSAWSQARGGVGANESLIKETS
ncbi:putative orotate phosphoribosyltransferase PyrE [Variovorax paradoxus B4]|uniref:Orotate phosphoribosyltransferase n=2 Tax=Variovorax paradoxus TaxID=34073 RepID=A0A0H2M489_VARPD|nr:phosphoribosyltransferase family protein [Variovorax paradoxus]AGU52661.1 putative orotate phosphoribosyltransferase PyrE [Variovorax paradoxus B4]KLN57229.1 orotate phosphoribosyltransferase [Variovorax paradoxus]